MRIRMIIALACLLASAAGATTLTTHMTVDNGFTLYVSTSDSMIGSYVTSGASWMDTYTGSFTLTPGVTHYLHVAGYDVGAIAGFIGDFALSDANFQFENGTQFLVSNAANWRVSRTGFGAAYETPTVAGSNGSSPWGFRPGIASAAQWIWTNYGYDVNVYRYFSTSITPVNSPAVPEASSLMLALGGLGAIGGLPRRKR